MNRKLVIVFFLIFSSIFVVVYSISTNAAPPPPTPSSDDGAKEAIEQAVLNSIDGQREYVLGYLINDVQVADVQLSQDGSWGVVYLEMIDPQTGEVLPSEPGLAFARWTGSDWEITLPTDPGWIDLVMTAPETLLTEEYKISYIEMYQTEILSTQATYSGYLLPWEAGKTVYLSQSTGHDKYIPSGSAHYSFDFYIYKTMYQLRASKAGTVWKTRWDVPDGDASDMGNYIVLKDTSTSPTTYQLYLHLAQDSIPVDLRTEGAYVSQGQFIGIADDTGQSTGHHLHFHVHTNPDSYWGTSVDITFDDVNINGGRPRRESDLKYCTRAGDVCNQYRNFYISGNVDPGDNAPPIGELFEPTTGFLADSSTIHVEGWSFDEESGVNHARLLAYYDNNWQEVGEDITEVAFSTDWNMCSDEVPNGPVSIALRIWDNAGNLSIGLPGLTHIIKNYSCNDLTPTCEPGENQIGIYSDTDFQGNCQILDLGEYTQLSPSSDNNVEAIQVGANVSAELFNEANFSGRSETIFQNESDLDDNQIGGNEISSIRVSSRSKPLTSPVELIYPIEGKQFPLNSSLSFYWRDPGGGTQFQVQVNGPQGETSSEWLSKPYWITSGLQLPEGAYTWKVRARNCADSSCNSPWSDSSAFNITSGTQVSSIIAPFSDDLESGPQNWQSSGIWVLLNNPDRSHSNSHSWYYGLSPDFNYDTGNPNSGGLTSVPILIPSNNFVLRFWYRYNTEGPGKNWDQRWIQISADGGPFDNVLQLYDDEPNYWLQAQIDLSAYAGKTIQIRFFFTSLDEQKNAPYEGWMIDDIEIVQDSLPTCSDADDTPAGANSISIGQTISGKICPVGDIDHFSFEGSAGDRIVLDIDTPTNNPVEHLDLYLFLVDSDGQSELAQHDDEILGLQIDPHLGYQLTRSGTYYVRARLWTHPSHGGEEFSYNLTLSKDNSNPQGKFASPLTGSHLKDSQNLILSVNATDIESGISHVEFLYHSGDWLATNWQPIGIDQDGSDGWQIDFDTTALPEQENIAFFANVYNWAGNWNGAGTWDLTLDRTPPETALNSLEPEQQSTAIKLQWTGSDNLSGIEYYEVQSRTGTGNWSGIQPNPSGSEDNRLFIGQSGNQYSFRLRGVDRAGNQESFPQDAETSTIIPDAATLCSTPDAWDNSGNDNTPSSASLVNVDDPPKTHNFCNPLTVDHLGDEDWIIFAVESGVDYLMESTPLSEMTGSILELYAADGTTLITNSQSKIIGENARIILTSDRTDQVYLRIRHLDGNIAGNIVSYNLKVNTFLPIFFPFIQIK
jgi:hypothetical protein